jgi:TFIIF-interacting CTD phosphatase-like protein
LDLDETLIHTSETKKLETFIAKVNSDYLHQRPHLENFLDEVQEFYSLSLWSTAFEDYIFDIIQNSILKNYKFEFIYSRKECTERIDRKLEKIIYFKNISNLIQYGYDLNRILIVDDSWEKIKFHYKNGILIKRFEGQKEDSELLQLKKLLFEIQNFENFRLISKLNRLLK